MNKLIKVTTIALFSATMSFAAASYASAQQSCCASVGLSTPSTSPDGGVGSGPENDGGESPDKRILIKYPDTIIDIQKPRPRPGINTQVVQRGDAACDPLYFLINQSNMLKTVPDYLECIQKRTVN